MIADAAKEPEATERSQQSKYERSQRYNRSGNRASNISTTMHCTVSCTNSTIMPCKQCFLSCTLLLEGEFSFCGLKGSEKGFA